MTRREKLERKLEKRQGWAEGRDAKATEEFAKGDKINKRFEFGQPILVGHHSEKMARRDRERAWNALGRGVENMNMADHHRSKAAGLQDQLDHTIFSDDEDAEEALTAKIEKLEAAQQHMVAVNKICKSKKLDKEQKAEKLKTDFPELSKNSIDSLLNPKYGYQGLGGYESFMLSNNNANIRRYKQRLEGIKALKARQERAEAAPGGVLIEGGEHVRITFPEKPEREIIAVLKGAGFYWRGGCWNGRRSEIPAAVFKMAEAEAHDSPAEMAECTTSDSCDLGMF